MIAGVSLVVLAAVLQGVFMLPMTRMRHWEWEHSWLAFSLAGMLVCNWILTLLLVPDPIALFAAVPRKEFVVLAGFGLAWGAGAVMFGRGMDMLGLALGYPLIMGLNAAAGTFVPLVSMYGGAMFAGRRALIGAGLAIAIAGISACSLAGAWKEKAANKAGVERRSRFVAGLMVACASGFLSCLPNIGLTFGANTLRTAERLGASGAQAGNAVWFLFFTFGGMINVLYCWRLVMRHGSMRVLVGGRRANWLWGLAMGAIWIAGFYLYGVGTARLGAAGASIGWPILVALSIGVGVLCGLGRGEWNGAPLRAKALLAGGLALIVLAVTVIPFGGAAK